MGRIRDLYIAKKLAGGGGGGSSYTLLHSEEIEVSTDSTTAINVKTISLGSEAYTSDKQVYVTIRDKAGPRAGYFYGVDSIFYNYYPKSGLAGNPSAFSLTSAVNSNGKVTGTTGSSGTGTGVYASTIHRGESGYSVVDLDIKAKYNSSYGTIDGTYIVEVYLSDGPADDKPLYPTIS